MLTISALARRFGLTRSTLLHYDRIGLLRPAERTGAGYRRYGDAEARRLERVCTYRRAGLSLATIAVVLGTPAARAEALRSRFDDLDREIEGLREQQRVIARLLRSPELTSDTRALDKATWVSLLRASGLSDEAMDRWHGSFERNDPGRHRRFLEALGIPAAEIAQIRGKAARVAERTFDLRTRPAPRLRSQSRGRPT